MKTRTGLLLLPLAALAACADNKVSVEIQTICAPPDDADKCMFASTCEAQNIGHNTLDVSVSNSLWLFLQVANQLPNNENLGDNRLNSNDAWVNEYSVEFDIALPESTGPILGSAWIPAEGSSVISVLPINETVASTLGGVIPGGAALDLVGHLRLRGVYGDTTEFETGVFDVPMRVCNGCVGPAPTCPTAGDVLAVCPKWGQSPASFKCVTP